MVSQIANAMPFTKDMVTSWSTAGMLLSLEMLSQINWIPSCRNLK
jgi:hypothetical protein